MVETDWPIEIHNKEINHRSNLDKMFDITKEANKVRWYTSNAIEEMKMRRVETERWSPKSDLVRAPVPGRKEAHSQSKINPSEVMVM
jgi:hypothetical protein